MRVLRLTVMAVRPPGTGRSTVEVPAIPRCDEPFTILDICPLSLNHLLGHCSYPFIDTDATTHRRSTDLPWLYLPTVQQFCPEPCSSWRQDKRVAVPGGTRGSSSVSLAGRERWSRNRLLDVLLDLLLGWTLEHVFLAGRCDTHRSSCYREYCLF